MVEKENTFLGGLDCPDTEDCQSYGNKEQDFHIFKIQQTEKKLF